MNPKSFMRKTALLSAVALPFAASFALPGAALAEEPKLSAKKLMKAPKHCTSSVVLAVTVFCAKALPVKILSQKLLKSLVRNALRKSSRSAPKVV